LPRDRDESARKGAREPNGQTDRQTEREREGGERGGARANPAAVAGGTCDGEYEGDDSERVNRGPGNPRQGWSRSPFYGRATRLPFFAESRVSPESEDRSRQPPTAADEEDERRGDDCCSGSHARDCGPRRHLRDSSATPRRVRADEARELRRRDATTGAAPVGLGLGLGLGRGLGRGRGGRGRGGRGRAAVGG
jgi:hypothetical protein